MQGPWRRSRRTVPGPSNSRPGPRGSEPLAGLDHGRPDAESRLDLEGPGQPRPAADPGEARTDGRCVPGWGRPLIIGIVGLVLLAGYFGYQFLQSRKGPGPLTFASPAASLTPNPDLAGLQTDDPPWDAALGTLRERLGQIGLPVLTAEDTSLHFHLHLDVEVDGKAVEVPDDIGRNEGAGFLTVIHTHTTDGVIHIESPKGHEYTLGQLFDVWGVRLTSDCLGGLCDEGDQQLRVYADGKLLDTRDPRLLILGTHQEILVTYGTADQVPSPVPSRYGFPLGA